MGRGNGMHRGREVPLRKENMLRLCGNRLQGEIGQTFRVAICNLRGSDCPEGKGHLLKVPEE